MRELYTPPTVGSTFKLIKIQQIKPPLTCATKTKQKRWLGMPPSHRMYHSIAANHLFRIVRSIWLIVYLITFVWSECLFTRSHSIQGFLYLDYFSWSGRSRCDGIRTHTGRILSPLPLPLGYASAGHLAIWPVIVYVFVLVRRFPSAT